MKPNVKRLEAEILKYLGPPTASAKLLARYIGAQELKGRQANEISELIYLGNKTSRLRKAAERPWAEFSKPGVDATMLWLELFKSSIYFDIKSMALFWIGARKKRSERLKQVPHQKIFEMVNYCDNWAISDGLSDLFADFLEKDPRLISIFKKWNKAKNPWLRRQSIVGLYYYARMRKKTRPVSEALKLVAPLLGDQHVYVQKGVGWTLREIYNLDPERQKVFVDKNLHLISSTAWFATSEFYPRSTKLKLVEQRKKNRKKKSKN